MEFSAVRYSVLFILAIAIGWMLWRDGPEVGWKYTKWCCGIGFVAVLGFGTWQFFKG
ncbi:hypothetical protein ACFQZE_16045 [Paenibacillus sp. GCM10027627]|uniref:hypothetical protein n=1 Tax=unclassified Paenibacillus TaxID=185978 RepID=UPI0036354212